MVALMVETTEGLEEERVGQSMGALMIGDQIGEMPRNRTTGGETKAVREETLGILVDGVVVETVMTVLMLGRMYEELVTSIEVSTLSLCTFGAKGEAHPLLQYSQTQISAQGEIHVRMSMFVEILLCREVAQSAPEEGTRLLASEMAMDIHQDILKDRLHHRPRPVPWT